MLWLSEPLALLGVDLQEVPGRWLLEETDDVWTPFPFTRYGHR
jgi:hypothetical protein